MNPSPKFCGKCGVTLEPDARFCGECGTAISEFQEPQNTQKSTPDGRRTNPSPPASEFPDETDTSSGQLYQKTIARIRSSPVWVRIGLLISAVLVLALAGGVFPALSLLVVLLIAFIIYKLIRSVSGNKNVD